MNILSVYCSELDLWTSIQVPGLHSGWPGKEKRLKKRYRVMQLWSKRRLHIVSLRWVSLKYRINMQWTALNHYIFTIVRFLWEYFVFVFDNISKNLLRRKAKWKTNKSMTIGMVSAFHPKIDLCSSALWNTLRRRRFNHNWLNISAWLCT